MDELTQKISEFLLTNPNSSAREIGKEIGFSKNAVNSCLYANEGTHFSKEGLTPPLWINIGDSSVTELAENDLAASDVDASNEDLEVEMKFEDGDAFIDKSQDKDLTRLSDEDQELYLRLNTRITRGEILNKLDHRLMNQLRNQIRRSKRNEISFVEGEKQKTKNTTDYADVVDSKVNEMWNPDQQRKYAIEALSLQFESNLRKLAYGYLISKNEKLFEREDETEIKIRQAKGREQVKMVSSSIETRLTRLESMSDADLMSSSVRFGWIRRESVNRTNERSSSEIFSQFEENERVKMYRSRFLQIVRRIDNR